MVLAAQQVAGNQPRVWLRLSSFIVEGKARAEDKGEEYGDELCPLPLPSLHYSTSPSTLATSLDEL